MDLGEGGEVQKLDEELAGEVGLVSWESFDGDEDGGEVTMRVYKV